MTNIRRGDRVTYWLIAEQCLCENNDHPPTPTLEPSPEPDVVIAARKKLADAGEFEDDETFGKLYPEAFAELAAHHAAHGAAAVEHAKRWIADKHPMHDYVELRELAARESARIAVLSDDEIVALHPPSNDEHARVASLDDAAIVAKFDDRKEGEPRPADDSEHAHRLRHARLAKIAAHARELVLASLPHDGVHAAPCGHLRTITGYPATVVGRVVDIDAETGARSIYYQLEVDFPEAIWGSTPTRQLGYIKRQGHCVLAEGRPQSGEFTVTTSPGARS